MLKRLCLLSIVLFTLTFVSTEKVKAQQVTVEYFYDQLAPYGSWQNVAEYGWVWKPYRTQPGWRPYSDGYWVYTEYGWTYQADNDWGWAVYHYGRWAYIDYFGWAWIPGTEWAPAWVAWRNDDNYIGWAPLPPQAEWRHGEGLHYRNFNIDVDIHWSNWCFVDINRFDDPRVSIYIQGPARNVTFIKHTHNITRYDYDNQRIVNRCIDGDNWERIAHRPLVRYNVVEASSDRRYGVRRSANNPEIRVYRPKVEARESQERQQQPRQTTDRDDLSTTKRYSKERSKYDKHSDEEYRKLVENQRKEAATPTQRNEDVQQQHNAEIDAYREQRTRETKTLETKHVNDMDKAVRKAPEKSQTRQQPTNTSNTRSTDTKQSDQKQSGRR